MRYYRVRLPKNWDEPFVRGFIGVGYGIHQDLSGHLPDEWRDFNKQFVPIHQKLNPEKSRISSGLACGMVWTVSKGIHTGDRVVSPDGEGNWRIGEIAGPYYYEKNEIWYVMHRRPVRWHEGTLQKEAMSPGLLASLSSRGAVIEISSHAAELDRLFAGPSAPAPEIPDAAFAMEKHLEDFLVANWPVTELGKQFDIYAEDGAPVGQQYPTDTGPIDILAISKDRKRLLVVELKRNRASDQAVGQLLRYMGYVAEELAEPGQSVEGAIIALDDDIRLRRAVSAAPNIRIYRYAISFSLVAQ